MAAKVIFARCGWDDAGGFAEDRGGTVFCDGVGCDFGPGEKLHLAPGESVTLMPGDWHAFWGEGGDVLVGEVSTVNDDETDNITASRSVALRRSRRMRRQAAFWSAITPAGWHDRRGRGPSARPL